MANETEATVYDPATMCSTSACARRHPLASIPCHSCRYKVVVKLLREARSLIDTLNGNIQGQTSAEVRDPIAYAACQDMITRIDLLVGRDAPST